MPPQELHPALLGPAAEAAGDSDMPLFQDVEVEGRKHAGLNGGRLKDISQIEANDRRPYALSWFRTAELCTQDWLECSASTTWEQVKTFCRRFEALISGRMGVLHFQELRTELQNMMRDAPPNTADKQLLLFITVDTGGLCSRADRIPPLSSDQTRAVHAKVVQMRRFASITCFDGLCGTGKSTTIEHRIAASQIDPDHVVRIHIHAATTITDVCCKPLAAGPWGTAKDEPQKKWALVIDVAHDAEPDIVNTVLDDLVLFGKLRSPSGLCCSAAVWSGWDVYIELQEAGKSWQERINLLQVSGLVTDGRSLLMPFKLDLADPRTGQPQHPGAVDAMPFIREHFEPAGGWQPSGGDANVAALTQLVRTSGAAVSHRNLARAAKFLAKYVPELRECPFFVFHEDAPAGDGHFVTKRDVGGMLAKCTVHGLRQHLKPGGEDHLHMCTGVGGFNCMLFGGSAPADIEHDAARTGIKVTRAQQGAAGGRSMPLYKLVDMLSAVSGVKSQKITQSLLENKYILTTDFLSKMVQQLLRVALGDLCILQGPSGTGKTACTLQTASLEPQSGNHPHNNLPRQLANFLRGEDLKQHFRDGYPPAAMTAEDVAKAAIPGVGTAELDEGKAELESKGQLSDFLNTVLNRSDWAVLHHVLDGLAGLATSGADQVLGDDEDAPPPEQPPAAAPPVAGAAAAALGESDGAAGADARDGGAAKPAGGVSTRKPRITSSAIDQIRSALFHVLDPHIKSDSELELAMAESLPGVDGRLGEKLKAVREDPERREQLYLGELRPLLELLHPNCCLTAADPVTTDRCVDAIKKITGCLVSGKTTFLSAAVLHVLTSRMSEVLARIPVPKAETLRRTLQKDQVDAALRCWGAKALERMGDAAQAGVAAIAKWMTGIIENAPLAKPTARFLELTRGAVPVASLPELLSEFVKTGAHDNHLVVLMRFDMDESELYEQMRPILERARRSAELYPDSPLHFVVFIDEANTCKSTGLLKHIMLDRKWDMCPGGKIPSNISFVAVINPAKRDDYLEGGEEHVASGYSDGDGDAEDEEGTDCMHDVNAFPPAFDHAIVPWRQLVGPGRDEFVTTKLYTNETVFSNQLSAKVIKALKDIVLTAHDFVQRLYRRKRARSTVSQRDIHRTFKLFDWFFARPDACVSHAIATPETKVRDAMILAVAVSYYFRLRPADRFHLAAKVDRAVEKSGAFDAQPLEELLAYVIDRYFIEMTHDAWLTGIFEHPPLRQNLFVQLVCFENRLAVVLHGPPGTSKTLSNNIVQDTMTGRNHFMAQFHQVGDVVRYQGSRQSAAAHIRKKCEECEENQRRYDDMRARRLSLLNIDEAGIVHSGDPMVLKVLHYYLGQAKFAAVLMTHDPLDTAVSNRCVEVRLTEPTPEELEYIACGIVRVNGVETLEETMRVLKALSRAYYKLREHGKLGKDLRRWYGLRDFYHLVRFFLRNEDRDGRVQPRKDQRCAVRITPRMLLEGLERNFNGPSGKKDSSNLFEAVMEEFQKQCSDLRPEWRAFGLHRDVLLDPRRRRNVVEVVANSLADNNRARGDSQSNMSDMWVRFKLLVDETPDGSLLSLLQECGLPEFRNIKVISLSELSKDEFHSVSVVQEISAAMKAGITVWLTNTREIDGSLFDLFSQSYTVCNGQDGQVLSFVPLGVGGVVEWKRVRENFQIIVHVMRSEVPLLPPPFLNRLEKFPVGTADVLAYRMGQIRRQGEQAPDEAEWSAEDMEAAPQHPAEQLAEIKWLGAKLAEAEANVTEALAVAERQLREAARGADELRRQLDAERATTAELKKQLGGEREGKEAAQSALAAVKCDAARLKGECDELRAQVEQTADKLAATGDKAARMTAQLAEAKADAAEAAAVAERQLAAARGEAARLTAQLDAAKTNAARAEADAERQRKAAREASGQLEAERAANAKLKNQLEAAREERAAAAEDAAARGAECTELKSQVAEQRAESERLQGQVDALRKEVDNGVSRQRDLEHQLDELRERLAAAEAPPCPAERRYFVPYAGEVAARSPGQVDAVNRSFLLQCADIPGAGSEQDFLDMYDYLKEQVDKRMKQFKEDGHDFRGVPEAAVRMILFWSTDSTACAAYKGIPKEFCSWINLALSYKDCDRPIRRALAIIRTLNDFCVTTPKSVGDSPAAPGERLAGAVMKEAWLKIKRNDWKLYRGGGFPPELKDWFHPGRTYRQPHYLATSLKQSVARRFAKQEGEKKGRIQVMWVIEIDADRKCCHLNYLGTGTEYSFFPEEELLFAPYSVFTVQSVDWAAPGSAEPSRICLKAEPDNKSDEFPLNLPEAPWS